MGAFPIYICRDGGVPKEAFMKNQREIFDDLKLLRVGYGVTGSQPKDPFTEVAMLKYGSYAFVNEVGTDHCFLGINPNPDLKWEEKERNQYWFGLHFMGGRFVRSIDYYNRDVDGLIYEYGVPNSSNLYKDDGQWG